MTQANNTGPGTQGKVVAQNAVISMLIGIIQSVLRLALPAYALRQIGMEQYGIWAFTFAIVSPIGMATFGVSSVYIRWTARYHGDGDNDAVNRLCSTGFFLTLTIAAIAYLAAWLVAPRLAGSLALSPTLRDTAVTVLRETVAIYLLSLSLGVCASVLDGIQKQAERAGANAVANFLEVCVGLAFLRTGHGIFSLVYAYLCRVLGEAAMMYVLSQKHLKSFSLHPRHFDRTVLPLFLRYGGMIQVTGFFSVCLQSAEKMAAGWLVGVWATALFELGEKFLFAVMSSIGHINGALLPAMCRIAESNKLGMRMLYVRGTRAVGLAAGPAFAFLAAFSWPLISGWLGQSDALELAPTIMFLFAIPYHMHVLTGPGSAMHRATGHPGREFGYHFIQATLLATLLPISLFFLGVNIAAIIFGVVPAMILSQLIYFEMNNRIAGVSRSAFFVGAVLPGFVPYLVALSLHWLLSPAAPAPDRAHAIRWLVGAGAVYGVVTIAVLYGFFLTFSERTLVWCGIL